MATKPLERLLFAQGGLCFFCQRTLWADPSFVDAKLRAMMPNEVCNDEKGVQQRVQA